VPSVLVADHEPEVAELARRYLERAGMRVQITGSPAETVRALAAPAADLFVIDLTMPGLEVRMVRQVLAPVVPAVFLLNPRAGRPYGLNSPPAVRQWLTRPFSPRALVSTVAGLVHPVSGLRRPPSSPADLARREILIGGRNVSLTRTEFALVAALAGQPGRVLSRQRLLAALESERGKRPGPRAVDVYITQLRAKLGAGAIRTVHGVGYALVLGPGEVPEAPEAPEAQGSAGAPEVPEAGQREGMADALRRQTPGVPPRQHPAGG
jgi:DNA-binding response OmpR family regulator